MITLESGRLVLRHFIESDLGDLHRLISDKENMYFLDDILTDSLEGSRRNLEMVSANADGHYFCVREKSGGGFVGSIGYTLESGTPFGKIVHMGYFLLPEHHGKGYATEAARRVLDFAFREDGCVRVTIGCYKDNVPSRRVMEKAGFRKEGERLGAQYHDGRMKDRLDYAVNKDEYLMNECLRDE